MRFINIRKNPPGLSKWRCLREQIELRRECLDAGIVSLAAVILRCDVFITHARGRIADLTAKKLIAIMGLEIRETMCLISGIV